MLLGALVDAGVPFASLAETAAALNVGARLEMRRVSRGGLAATKVDVLRRTGLGTVRDTRMKNMRMRHIHTLILMKTTRIVIPTSHTPMRRPLRLFMENLRTAMSRIGICRRSSESSGPRRSLNP